MSKSKSKGKMGGYWKYGSPPGYYYGWYGPYGVRPGVERPDEEIRSDIIKAMERDSSVDPSHIEVTVENGIVTLSGVVESTSEKRAAGDDAWDTPGVVDIHDELQVRHE